MKLLEKIADMKVAYLFRREERTAFELALLYFILAKRKKSRPKIADACARAVFWLKRAGVDLPEYYDRLGPPSRLDELEGALVANRAKICLRSLPAAEFLGLRALAGPRCC